MTKRFCMVILPLAIAGLAPTGALAQDDGRSEGVVVQERPRDRQDQEDAGPGARVVVVRTPSSAEPAQDYARVRFHAAIAGGGFFGDVAGGMGGLSLAIGAQFNQYLGLYYQAQGMLGAFLEGGQNGAVAALLYNSLIFDVTLGHTFQVGAGPSLDFLAGCAAGSAGAGCGDGGPFFGLDARVALALGGHGVGTRGAFVLSADLHPTFYPNGVSLALIVGLGGQVF